MTGWAAVLESVRQAVGQARDELNRLDAAAGDGDLGLTMTAAADGAAALAARGDLDGKTTAEALRALGMELARCAPSTSGTLFARGLLQAARAAATQASGEQASGSQASGSQASGSEASGSQAAGSQAAGSQAAEGHAAGADAADSPVAQAAALVEAAIEGIQRAGKAQPGDRTMLDALVPLARTLQEAAGRGDPPAAAAAAAAEAARAGAEATRDLEPKVGRASWIADRAKGNVDGGAYAVAIIAAAVAIAIS